MKSKEKQFTLNSGRSLETGSKLEMHITIQKRLSIPPLEKCNNCCSPAKFHCPFCLPSFFKPAKHSRIKLHLVNHLKSAIYLGEYTIHRCGLDCRTQQHYHCLFCKATLIKKQDITNHLPCCHKAHRGQRLGREDGIPSYDIESNDDDNVQGASGSQLMTPIVEDDTVGMRSTEAESTTCDRSVQTNVEKPQDCDEFYFMSLVKMFKKLSPGKKAEVRMKIERLLFEAEFE